VETDRVNGDPPGGRPPPGTPVHPGLRALMELAWPVILSRSTQSVVGLSDALFSARLGDQALAAVTTGAINWYSLAVLPMGTVFIVQSFAAQLQGRGDLAAARRYAGHALLLAGLTTVLAVAATPFIGSWLSLFRLPPGVHDDMTAYLQWRFWSVGPFIAVEALGNWFSGLGNTRVHMRASLLTMAVNVPLCWALVFGKLGLPAMGVRGAALANGLATCIGLAYIAAVFARHLRAVAPGEPWRPFAFGPRERAEFVRLHLFGVPNGLNWFMEIAAFTIFLNAVVSRLGTTVLAAMNAILQINSISFMPAFGLASAGAVLVGQAIGRGDKDDVPRLLGLTARVALAWQVSVGLVYFCLPRQIMRAFASRAGSSELVVVGASMLALSAAWQVFDALGLTIGEALRAAGDTAWCMWARLLSAWTVFVPVAWWVVTLRHGGPAAVIGVTIFYLAVLAGAFLWRFQTGAWRLIELVEIEPPA
jgi:MATE family multidrug resistance protein